MGVKQWSPGDVLTASDMNTWTVPLVISKPADTSRSSNTTLTADPDLLLPVAANALYEFFMFLNFEGATTGSGDIKWNFTVPTSATLRYQCLSDGTGGGGVNPLLVGSTSTGTTTNAAASNGSGNPTCVGMWGNLDTAGTAGNFVFNWAQQTSSGTSTIVHTQSTLRLQRIG